MSLLLGILAAGMPLVCIEVLSRIYTIAPETSRKLVHVLSAAVTAALALYLPLRSLSVIAGLFCLLLIATRATKLWRSLYKVKRKSWGEIAFPAGVLWASLFSDSAEVFICAVMVMGLADTAASIVGMKFGKRKILYTSKTIVGSTAFLVVAALVFVIFGFNSWAVLAGGVVLAAIAELATPHGLDNFTVPAVIVLWLGSTSTLL